MRVHKDAQEKIQEWIDSPLEFHSFNEFVSLTQEDYELLEYFAMKQYPTKASKKWFKDLGGFEKAKKYRYGDIYRLVGDLTDECCFMRKTIARKNDEGKWQDFGIRREIEAEIPKAFKCAKGDSVRVLRNVYDLLLSRFEASVLVDRMKAQYAEKDANVNQMDLKLAFEIIKGE